MRRADARVNRLEVVAADDLGRFLLERMTTSELSSGSSSISLSSLVFQEESESLSSRTLFFCFPALFEVEAGGLLGTRLGGVTRTGNRSVQREGFAGGAEESPSAVGTVGDGGAGGSSENGTSRGMKGTMAPVDEFTVNSFSDEESAEEVLEDDERDTVADTVAEGPSDGCWNDSQFHGRLRSAWGIREGRARRPEPRREGCRKEGWLGDEESPLVLLMFDIKNRR